MSDFLVKMSDFSDSLGNLTDGDVQQAPLTVAVSDLVAELPDGQEGGPLSVLAMRYAHAIDRDATGEVLGDLGPKLVRVLGELGLTPASRARIGTRAGQPGVAGASPLAAVRASFRPTPNGCEE